MAKFCGKCGAKLDEATGLCPNCDADKLNKQTETPEAVEKPKPKQDTASEPKKPLSKKEAKKQHKADKKAAKKAKKKEKWASMTLGQKLRKIFLKLAMWVLLIAVFAGVAIVGLSHHNIIEIPGINEFLDFIGLRSETVGSAEEYKVNAPDAESYYGNNSDIIMEIDVNDSNDVLTESETCTELTGRGFEEYPITTEYSMDGAYSDATNISDNSSNKHPIYQTYYVSSNGDLWTVFVINGSVLANPVSYNLQSGRSVQAIVSETETVMSYDSATNRFYETIPHESALVLITVDKIDAETLDKLTAGEIERYG
ncbi:zinc ribbon domain-containing protein [Pseudoflavonifractor phocaeensis]|uniref:zinc ribbon domain-containing protein n=1 Tax=Pseudoflavonifractor phocaeensis TaxID=1870988 RepID=UPI001F3E2701|nr:zinc ribbon domain-containing protein [Pseudoflavonifractor phocaeensis]MCF2596032.1 zinc ribbon domain-containing protein [Pseudoflavonifractor phocaeensis]